MTLKRLLIGAALVIVGIPVLLVAGIVVTFKILDRTNGALVSSGIPRRYLLHVPPSYDANKPTPLVLSLHGAAGWPMQQRNMTGWDRLADEKGFLVAYPAGRGTPQVWSDGPVGAMQDVRFISDLIDTISAHYRVDPARIFVNGLSNGGMMTFAVSCRLADRIAAVGLVSAAMTMRQMSEWCANAPPMPAVIIHGTGDRIVPFGGGALGDPFNPAHPVFPPVRAWVADWGERNRCAAAPVDSVLSAKVTRTLYTRCADSATVVLYAMQGGGHQWPGGKALPAWWVGPMNDGLDATHAIWTFYEAHPMRGARAGDPRPAPPR